MRAVITPMNHAPSNLHLLVSNLTELVDARRVTVSHRLDPKKKIAYGQFMTPRPVAQFMASLFKTEGLREVRLLDAGAGVGSLTAAVVAEICSRRDSVRRIEVTAYEIDTQLIESLTATFNDCAKLCQQEGILFEPKVVQRDFLEDIASPLFMQGGEPTHFTHAILNPPYRKIASASNHRLLLRSMGVETSNLYTGFLAVAINLLEPEGQLVAITPRSFCNGPYFRPFRQLLLAQMAIQQIHIFESRIHAFKDDAVLQENIILHATKTQRQGSVVLSTSKSIDLVHTQRRTVEFQEIVKPNDEEFFIHIAVNNDDQRFARRMGDLPCTLKELGIDVSTGPIVDFRLKEYLRRAPEPNTIPLIYPEHCMNGFVVWPLANSRKPNAIADAAPVQKWLYSNGHYTLLRRLSSKEERRRVVASIYEPYGVPGEKVGFENHLNVFHQGRQGLTPDLARGLAVYLNSTFYDTCFRQFNGNTQVNVKDLYNLRYPDLPTLEELGKRVVGRTFPNQHQVDAWIEEKLF